MTLMTIGQLGRRAGVRPSAIRYYEAHGILPRPIRSSNGYRLYGSDAVTLLRFGSEAKKLGFSLDEIRHVIEASQDTLPCTLSRKIIEHHLAQVERELCRLQSLRERLAQLLEQPMTKPTSIGICPLIGSGAPAAEARANEDLQFMIEPRVQ